MPIPARDGLVPVAIEYHLADEPRPTAYTRFLAEEAIGLLLLVIDALAETDDTEHLHRLAGALTLATSGQDLTSLT
ncbi:hypothetical protein [Catenulispora rubra]|uniref:hypothetical protein n=1 Tax=Catenulispora rubra TaxID=280293 RepID=UPI0018922193|nr:hypothetical protein [Catenulispora rubra]